VSDGYKSFEQGAGESYFLLTLAISAETTGMVVNT
jgi:hypothetical protein